MAGIITNVNTLVVQNTALKNSSVLQQSVERLSSGMRINSAKDDAAGQTIANRMGSQIKGLLQAQRNASDSASVSVSAVTSSVLYSDISTLPSRTVSGLSFVDDSNAAMGADALVSSNGKYYIQQGTDYYEAELNWGPTGAMQAKVTDPTALTTLTSPVNVTTTPAVDLTTVTPSFLDSSGNAVFGAATGWTTINLRETGDGIRLRNPEDPLATLDAAIARVDQRRSLLGATVNRLESVQNVQTATSTALSASRSRIEDADYAEEVF